jgi:cysteine synthase A
MYADSPLEAVGATPLVELGAVRPDGGARVLAKWEGANPTGSMKDRMATAIVRAARERGDLQPGQRVAELTGGSTGSSLAMVCAALDHPATLVTADCFATEKIRTMRALGAEVDVVSTPDGRVHPDLRDDMQARLDEVVARTSAYWTDQFTNTDALEGYAGLGREILSDAPGITDFVMGVGTGGCAMGTARALRAERDVHVTLLEPAESPYLTEGEGGDHDVEGLAVLEDPPMLDDDRYDDVRTVPEADALEMARRLAAETGLFAGASTGLNVAAAVEVAAERDADDVVVTVACDTGLKYLDGELYRG